MNWGWGDYYNSWNIAGDFTPRDKDFSYNSRNLYIFKKINIMKCFIKKFKILVSSIVICLIPILYGCDSEDYGENVGPSFIKWETTAQFTNDKEMGKVVLVPASGETMKFQAKDIYSLVIVAVAEADSITEKTSTFYKEYWPKDKYTNTSVRIEGEYSDVRRDGQCITVKIAPNTTKKARYVFVPTTAAAEDFIGTLRFKQSAE